MPNGVQGYRTQTSQPKSLEIGCLKDLVGEEVLGILDWKEALEFPLDFLFAVLSLFPIQILIEAEPFYVSASGHNAVCLR